LFLANLLRWPTMFDNSSFQPPPPVTTVQDLLRYPTEKLVALEQALPLQAAIRPVLLEALRRRGIMQGH
jgi:hypothetical protein